MNNILRTLIVIVCLLPKLSAAEQSRAELLDELLDKGQFNQLFIALAPERFKRPPLSSETSKQDMAWLQAKAEAGHVPLVYVYGYRLAAENQDEALVWYARARIWAFLDSAECAVPTRTPWYTILEGYFGNEYLNPLRKRNPLAYLRSVDDTLRAENSPRVRPSAKWYCAAGLNDNVLPTIEASSARSKRVARLLEDNQKKLAAGRDE